MKKFWKIYEKWIWNKNFSLSKYEDLVICGLGYVESKEKDISHWQVTVPKGVKVLTRKSISKFSDFDDEEEFDDLM